MVGGPAGHSRRKVVRQAGLTRDVRQLRTGRRSVRENPGVFAAATALHRYDQIIRVF